MGEWLLISMQSVTDSDGDPEVFEVGHGSSGLWLDSSWLNLGGVWYPLDR